MDKLKFNYIPEVKCPVCGLLMQHTEIKVTKEPLLFGKTYVARVLFKCPNDIAISKLSFFKKMTTEKHGEIGYKSIIEKNKNPIWELDYTESDEVL